MQIPNRVMQHQVLTPHIDKDRDHVPGGHQQVVEIRERRLDKRVEQVDFGLVRKAIYGLCLGVAGYIVDADSLLLVERVTGDELSRALARVFTLSVGQYVRSHL
jgi:hypothetical protein